MLKCRFLEHCSQSRVCFDFMQIYTSKHLSHGTLQAAEQTQAELKGHYLGGSTCTHKVKQMLLENITNKNHNFRGDSFKKHHDKSCSRGERLCFFRLMKGERKENKILVRTAPKGTVWESLLGETLKQRRWSTLLSSGRNASR